MLATKAHILNKIEMRILKIFSYNRVIKTAGAYGVCFSIENAILKEYFIKVRA